MLKELIAIVDNAEEAGPFIDRAVAFAEAQDAHLAITVLTRDFTNVYALSVYGIPPIALDNAADDQKERLEVIRQRVSHAAVPVEVRGITDDPTLLRGVSRVEGRYADLLLMGPASSYEEAGLRRKMVESALMSSGGPVMILPEQIAVKQINHAVVGWDASAEARRAIRDLMTVIQPGGTIDIVVVDAEASTTGYSQLPGSNIARLLARHGYNVEVHQQSSVGRTSITETLESFALSRNADLLVIGAFAHPRVRDILLGGVTRDLVDNVRLPVLMSR